MQERTTGLWFSPENPVSNRVFDPFTSREATLATRPPERPIEHLKILIWSADEHEAQRIQDSLKLRGFTQTQFVTSYDEGFGYLKMDRFDLFIIDWQFGENSGLRLVQALRNCIAYRQTPMLVSTHRQEVDDMLAAMQAGASDLLACSAEPELIVRKIAIHSKAITAA